MEDDGDRSHRDTHLGARHHGEGLIDEWLTESAFHRVDLLNPFTASDFLLDPAAIPGTRGWFLVLNEEERVITDAFSLSGVTIFSSFVAQVEVTDADGDPVEVGCTASPGGGRAADDPRCAKFGTSNIFAVNTTNANGLLLDDLGNPSRSIEISGFVSNPFTEPGGSRNPDIDSGGAIGDDLTPRLAAIMESLKALFPKNCKFANYRIDVKIVAADTSTQFIAPVPVCIVDKHWKEF